jgi:hypothetical protein
MGITHYTVTGRWPFPKELMSQDRTFPASLADRNNIILIEDEEISEENKEKKVQHRTNVPPSLKTIGRGCRLLGIERMEFQLACLPAPLPSTSSVALK